MRFIASIFAALAAVISLPAAAQDWYYAESDHFRVYSEGGAEAARDMAVKLERLDQAMRLFTGVPLDTGAISQVAKPTLFQFGETKDIGELAGQNGVAGFFIPRAGNSVAFVPLKADTKKRRSRGIGTREGYEFYDYQIDPQKVLFHEYSHYFMFQHKPAAYPPWYIEGLAELFGTMRLTENGFAVGDPPEHRMASLAYVDVDLDEIFLKDDRTARSIRYPYYAHGWLLSSYLTFAPERAGQLAKFLTSINQGMKTREAAEDAFGDLKQLERELNKYRNERARGMSAEFSDSFDPQVELRALKADEVARMKPFIRSVAGVTPKTAKKVLGETQELEQRYPDSVAVMRTALEAEFDAGNYNEAGDIARKLLDTDQALDAHLYLAKIAMKYAEEDPNWLTTAREEFLNANNIEPHEPNALAGYYLTYRLSGEEPPEDALIALETAYSYAPFDQNIRILLAHLLLLENRDASAMNVLAPVIYQPHGGKYAEKIRDLIESTSEGNRQPLIDELAPSLKPKDD
ncbi:hypothetical protein [Pseudoblastomonas halimionae]|uniref:Tetratricopeptide repeat protein n=1 Tax=Alteriqipengyuania halimionae TaxID=1926630 RepID=A0A6I4U2A0_9SPHN|nr:hypothetical protein [Alteriqipengyuania halimionae]MXP09065.1 hypothetical protein [Alteriqipengyuania halimionae]